MNADRHISHGRFGLYETRAATRRFLLDTGASDNPGTGFLLIG